MKEKQNEFLLQIKNGVVDFYWGLKIETELSFAKFCDSIQRTVNGAFEKYNNHIRTIMEQDASRTIQEQKMQNELHVKSAKNRAVTENNATVEEQADVCGFEIELMANGVKIIPRTLLYEYLSFWTNEMDYDFDYSGEVYGDIYTSSQRRFILPPIKIELENGVVTLLSAILFAFPDKTAILRITLPIDDTDSLYLKQNEIDSYIVNAKIMSGFPLELADKSIESIKSSYCLFLSNASEVQAVTSFGRLTNIIFANYSGMVDRIKDVSDDVKEELYKISISPVQERKGDTYRDEAVAYFNESSWLTKGMGVLFSSMGKCISLVDKSVISFLEEKVEEEQLYNKVVGDVRRSVEFAIVITVLKNINQRYAFGKGLLHNGELKTTKAEYSRGKILVSLLQSGAYGSARELSIAFEKNMTFFLDTQNVEDRMHALNEILEEEYSERVLELQNVVSVVGLVFAVIFGLPAVNQTLTHIRKLCTFIGYDIPFLSIENCSFLIWLLIVIGLFLVVIFKSKRKNEITL